jgi:hypothetical protein
MGMSSVVSFEDIKEIHLNVINHQFKTIGPHPSYPFTYTKWVSIPFEKHYLEIKH